MILDRRQFILDNTRLQSPPHTPELKLHLADEISIRWPNTRIVLATGYSVATLDMSKRKWPLLKKPFTLSELSAVLNPGSGERRATSKVEE